MTRPTTPPSTLHTSVSPPPPRSRRSTVPASSTSLRPSSQLRHWTSHLGPFIDRRPTILPLPAFSALYARSLNPRGHHFVIHQHDHPIAGLHYDLRLQINGTSSASWAVPYGLPGDPNSRRLNRGAVETRVHCLWNHLVETASVETGSMLVWDTGEYEVLPWRRRGKERMTDDEDSNPDVSIGSSLSEPEKLHEAFQIQRIRLRLHSARLPKNYTISLRLSPIENRHEQPRPPSRKRKRRASPLVEPATPPPASDHENDDTDLPDRRHAEYEHAREKGLQAAQLHETRRTNAYPGASNSIGSIHQRRWFLSLDRHNSGFIPVPNGSGEGRKRWDCRVEGGEVLGFEPFYVRGREVERSVVTGRLAEDVRRDEGVEGGRVRSGWVGIV